MFDLFKSKQWSFLAIAFLPLMAFLNGCSGGNAQKAETSEAEELRIVSLNPTASEFLFALELNEHLVARDISSTYPAAIEKVPVIGSNHNISIEGLLNFQPSHVIYAAAELSTAELNSLSQAGIETIEVTKPNSMTDSKSMLETLAQRFGKMDLIHEENSALSCFTMEYNPCKRFIFVYAHGGGNLLVSGNDTPVSHLIELAGGVNVASDISGFKSLNSESLVNYDPEVVILFDHGLAQLDNGNTLWNYPGMSTTVAGKNKKLLSYPAHLLSGFGLETCNFLKRLHADLDPEGC